MSCKLFNTLRPRRNSCHFPDNIFKCIFSKENARISLKISLKFVHEVRFNHIPELVQTMAWHRTHEKPAMCRQRHSFSTVNSCSRNNWNFMKWEISHFWWDSNPRPIVYMPSAMCAELRECDTFQFIDCSVGSGIYTIHICVSKLLHHYFK